MRDCIRAANLRSSSVTYVTMPMTTFSTMKPTSASTASGGSVMGAGSASPARAVGGLAEMVSGCVRSSVDFTKDGIDGAHDGHDVGDLHAGQDVREHREVGERSAAPLEPVGLRPAVGDEITADLAARALDAPVALALRDAHLAHGLDARPRRDGSLRQPVQDLPRDGDRLAELGHAHAVARVAIAGRLDRNAEVEFLVRGIRRRLPQVVRDARAP